MAEGTKDYRWEYEEILLFDEIEMAKHTERLWVSSLQDNLDYLKGEIEIFTTGGTKLVIRYSWKSNTMAWVKTDGIRYGLAIMPKGQPSLIIMPPDKKIDIPKDIYGRF